MYDPKPAAKVGQPRKSCAGVMTTILAIVALTVLYTHTVTARPYPSAYDTFWWGCLHGAMVIPSFVFSLFSRNVATYQHPNDGLPYNLGFLIGAALVLAGIGTCARDIFGPERD